MCSTACHLPVCRPAALVNILKKFPVLLLLYKSPAFVLPGICFSLNGLYGVMSR